jgi:aspartyl-tRNA(Asn)/glutamyl-tRNA(Gln) amidotransferase subunit B
MSGANGELGSIEAATPELRKPTQIKWDDRLEQADKELVARLNASLDKLDGRRAVEINVSGAFLRSKVAWKLAVHQHGLLHRIVALMDGTAVAWNSRSTLSAFLSARALMETIAVVAEYERSVASLLAKKDIGGLDALAQQGIFSSRDPELVDQAPEIKAINILGYIDKFEKRAASFRNHYDQLSERCHPNALGHNYMFSKLDRSSGTVRFYDERDPDKNGLMIMAALSVLPLIEPIMAELDALILNVSDLHYSISQTTTGQKGANMNTKANKLIKGATGDWEMVIGLEVHAQVTSNSKLFSGASTEFGGEPNSHVSLVDAAMPGMLPVINEFCVKQAVRTGLGLNAQINRRSVFDRKNYFYPDSPQGYQISQYKSPIVGEGEVVVELAGGESVTVGIERLHLEQDAAKLLHDQSPAMSFVDLNRSGVALMEIVSKPDIRSSEQAKAYVAKLRSILRYLGTCDGDMEKGSLRADVNVSVRKTGGPLGTRCEIKNMNSISFIGQAIEYEARRQIEILEDGGAIDQETRLFDPNKGETRSMRSKEEAHDYRYFPDPDLLPLEFTQAYIDELKADLPELPDQKKARFISSFGITPYVASVLVSEPALAKYFEDMIAENPSGGRADPKVAANWLINEHLGRLNKENRTIETSPIPAAANGAIVTLIFREVISGKIAKEIYEIAWNANTDGSAQKKIYTFDDVEQVVETRGMKQVTDLGAIERVVDDIIAANPDKVAQARAKPQLIAWFVGQAMKASGGKANPQAVNDLLKSKLGL